MSWVRLDDQFAHHPKVLRAGPTASFLWIACIAYCQKFLTDGFVPERAIATICDVPDPTQQADMLVSVGLLELADGGFQVHDYLQFNESSESVKRRREADRQRKDSSRIPAGFQSDSSRTPTRARAPAPHPIPSREEQQQQRGEPPVFTGQRFVVMPFMQERCERMLGNEAEGFNLHSWYFKLDAAWADKGIIDNSNGRWLEKQLMREVRNRGLSLGSQHDIDHRVSGNGNHRERQIPVGTQGRNACHHDPPCERTTECAKRTINENRALEGKALLP